jgi:hypothetical protein
MEFTLFDLNLKFNDFGFRLIKVDFKYGINS